MSKEAVLMVISAEEQAKEIVSKANFEAELMIKEAKEKAEKDYLDHVSSVEAEYNARLQQVSDQAESLIGVRLKEAENDANVICKQAAHNVPYAVREVLRRIMNECQ